MLKTLPNQYRDHVNNLFWMPRPCAVEAHARGYNVRETGFADGTALCRGDSRSLQVQALLSKSNNHETPRGKPEASQMVFRFFG